jgi:hypothetical protein
MIRAVDRLVDWPVKLHFPLFQRLEIGGMVLV